MRVLFSACLTASALATISPVASPWRIIGRHRTNVDGHVDFDHAGVKIVARFTGSVGLSAVMSKVGSVEDVFVVSCDGVAQVGPSHLPSASFSTGSWIPDVKQTVTLCSGLDPASEHEVVIFKSTEAAWNDKHPSVNYASFYSFDASSDLQLLPLPEPQARRIEFLGDSITAGYCNLCGQASGLRDESHALAFPTLTCEALDAECHVAAWSGYGMVKNCCGGETLASDIWLRTLASMPSGNSSDPHGTTADNRWHFRNWVPDAVVINLGTNDGLTDDRAALIPAFNSTYLGLIKDAASAYGSETRFFLACGPMRESYCEPVQWVIAEAVAAGIKATFLDQRGFTHPSDCCGHPGAAQHVEMASSTVDQIKAAMSWGDSMMV